MGDLLSKVGRAVLRASIPALFILMTGFLASKNLGDVGAAATTFAVAIAVAAFTTIQAFIPQFSWRSYVPEAYAKYLDAFTQAFLGTFVSLAIGFFTAPNWATWQSVWTAIIVGAATAGVRAIQAIFQPGEPVLDPEAEPKAPPTRVSIRPSLKPATA